MKPIFYFRIDYGNTQETGSKLAEVQTALSALKQSLLSLEGSDCSAAQQKERIEHLQSEIQLKNQLIAKYKDLGISFLEDK